MLFGCTESNETPSHGKYGGDRKDATPWRPNHHDRGAAYDTGRGEREDALVWCDWDFTQ